MNFTKTLKRFAGAMAFVLVAPGAAVAQPPALPLPSGITSCAFDATPNDPDPAGLNIRSAPNAGSRILGKLPNVESPQPGVGTITAEFHVIGTQNGWFLIEGARYRYGYRAQPYAGRGWVSGKLITTGLRETYLKGAPRDDAADVVKLSVQTKDSAAGPDSFLPSSILACSGKWFEVEVPLKQAGFTLKPLVPTGAPRGYVRGWTDSYCTNQLTTCV